ncbi:OmpA family protein [bacterium]|nr:OmpA family protein [bacterium]
MIAKKEMGGGVPDWIVTFADLMTLLFCFFVLLTTLSTQPKSCNGIQEYLDQNSKRFRNFELRSSKLQCILTLPSDYLFRSGSDVVQKGALNSLSPMFSAIRQMEEHKNDLLIVEGHTDDVPIKTKKFPSNWELSSARATNVATFLVNQLKYSSNKVSVGAYADSRPKERYLDDYGKRKTGAALREAREKNRRVEIILEKQPKSREETKVLFDGR